MAPVAPLDHLKHFMHTVDDYEQFSVALPLPAKLAMVGRNDTDRWVLVAHAMMLRKYYSGDPKKPESGDDLNLNAVIRSLRQIVNDPAISSAEWDRMEANAKTINDGAVYVVNGEKKSEYDILDMEIYSRYLHGNPAKWRKRSTSEHAVEHALWRATNARSRRFGYVAALVREQVKKGNLHLTGRH